MRPDGTGLLISDQVYRTVDGGRTWTPTGQDEVWTAITGVSFVSPAVGYAAFRSTGDVSGVDITTDGGLTWRPAAAWNWWSFDRVYLSTPSTRP
jgi:photosystem II stability/assembly factor-like uncharacterized protein